MRARNIDAVALVCLTLLLLVIEAAGNHVSAFASRVAHDGWCPRTAVLRTISAPLPCLRIPSVARLHSMAR